MPITPEQALALTDSENEQLQKLFVEIDCKLKNEYDYDEYVRIELPTIMRQSVRNVLIKTYESTGWSVDEDGEDGENIFLLFSSSLTVDFIPYNKPSGSPYR
ncbi:MAG TPA: hypothetical protein VI423_02170 [Paenisporosarcina sp.]|nr:hypothetical protein [Paenisporosarcina sp.]